REDFFHQVFPGLFLSYLRCLPLYRQTRWCHPNLVRVFLPHWRSEAAPHSPLLPGPPNQNFPFLKASEKDPLRTILPPPLPVCPVTGYHQIVPGRGNAVPSCPVPARPLPAHVLPEYLF